jgi:ACS family tartrate transporter-like MFS transporter
MNSDLEKSTIRAVTWRLIPLLVLGYLIAYVDRINVGFAATALRHDLGLSNSAFGFGAGLFFFGYFLFEVPSNLILERVGARLWMARIMIGWGILSSAMVLVGGEYSFYLLRFLIGIGEAGFFPGVLFLIVLWYPKSYRTRLMALFTAGIPLSSVIGAPLSSLLLGLDGWLGLPGWWWMFLLEGGPAILVGLALFLLLPNRPRDAAWLSAAQKDWLDAMLAAEDHRPQPWRLRETLSSFYQPRVLALALSLFANIAASIGLAIFLPQIIASTGTSRMLTGWLTTVPALFGLVGLYVISRLAGRYGDRPMLIVSVLLSFAGLLIAAFFGEGGASVIGLAALSLAAMGIHGLKGPFWSLAPVALSGPAAAGGIAWINSIGNLGGWFGPTIIGWASDQFHGYHASMYALAILQLLAAMLLLLWAPRNQPVRK